MPEFDDTEVMAYADGQLDAARAAELAATARHDPDLRARIEAFAGSRRILRRAFDPSLEQPLPDSVLRLFDTPAATTPRVQPLRAARRRPPRWTRMAMAAGLVGAVALGVGRWLGPGADTGPLTAMTLASSVLERQPSGEPVVLGKIDGAPVEALILASLREADGRYCRRVETTRLGAEISSERAQACRAPDGDWSLVADVAGSSGTPDSAYVPASGNGGATRALSATEEAALIASGWQSPAESE